MTDRIPIPRIDAELEEILRERHFLQSEIAALEELIRQTPEEDVIDRKSLEARKKEVEAEFIEYEVRL